uniref:Uncharacterized protein n=1 Tax=Janibacter limosus TaxID=53458 RepID=A0AC61U1R2_9MICO|nr:FtsK/SpoIIIE domain-containing protein [Janibacter limosus]
MVVGGPGSGRTSSIASLVTAAAGRWGPDRLHVQVLGDGSSRLASLTRLPHVGSVVDGEESTVVGRFLDRLEDDIAERRSLLRTSGHSTLDARWAAHDTDPAPVAPPPHLLLAIDGWGRITRPRGSMDLGESAEVLETLMRDGIALGLRVLVTGGRELLSGRVSSLVTTRLVLHLGDRGDAALAGLARGEVSERLVPGRGRLQPGGHLVQVALPRRPPEVPPDEPPPVVPPWVVEALPTSVPLDLLANADRERVPLGLGGCGTEPIIWHTDGARRFLVCGPPRSGRSTTLAALAHQLVAAGHPPVVVGSAEVAAGLDCPVIGPDDHDSLIALRQRHPDPVVVADDLERPRRIPGGRRAQGDRAPARRRPGPAHRVDIDAECRQPGPWADLRPRPRPHRPAPAALGALRRRRTGSAGPPLARVPGRGYLVVDGRALEVQVAHPRVGLLTTGP